MALLVFASQPWAGNRLTLMLQAERTNGSSIPPGPNFQGTRAHPHTSMVLRDGNRRFSLVVLGSSAERQHRRTS
jgi:hypothetical protein